MILITQKQKIIYDYLLKFPNMCHIKQEVADVFGMRLNLFHQYFLGLMNKGLIEKTITGYAPVQKKRVVVSTNAQEERKWWKDMEATEACGKAQRGVFLDTEIGSELI